MPDGSRTYPVIVILKNIAGIVENEAGARSAPENFTILEPKTAKTMIPEGKWTKPGLQNKGGKPVVINYIATNQGYRTKK